MLIYLQKHISNNFQKQNEGARGFVNIYVDTSDLQQLARVKIQYRFRSTVKENTAKVKEIYSFDMNIVLKLQYILENTKGTIQKYNIFQNIKAKIKNERLKHSKKKSYIK